MVESAKSAVPSTHTSLPLPFARKRFDQSRLHNAKAIHEHLGHQSMTADCTMHALSCTPRRHAPKSTCAATSTELPILSILASWSARPATAPQSLPPRSSIPAHAAQILRLKSQTDSQQETHTVIIIIIIIIMFACSTTTCAVTPFISTAAPRCCHQLNTPLPRQAAQTTCAAGNPDVKRPAGSRLSLISSTRGSMHRQHVITRGAAAKPAEGEGDDNMTSMAQALIVARASLRG